MCVNDIPRVATRQCGGRDSNLRPVECKSSAPITIISYRAKNKSRPKIKTTNQQSNIGGSVASWSASSRGIKRNAVKH